MNACFFVINKFSKSKTFKELIRRIFSFNKIKAEEKSSAGVRYILLTPLRRKINWEKISQITGRGRLIACKGLDVPEKYGRLLYRDDEFEWDITLSCAEEWCRTLSGVTAPSKRIYGLFDKNAEYTDYVEQFIGCCSTVKVITERKDEYLKVGNTIIDEYGAGIMVSDSADFFCGCTAVFAPDITMDELRAVSSNAPVFAKSTSKAACGHGKCVCCALITPKIDNEVPDCERVSDFISALYKLGGFKGNMQCEITLLNGDITSFFKTDAVIFGENGSEISY